MTTKILFTIVVFESTVKGRYVRCYSWLPSSIRCPEKWLLFCNSQVRFFGRDFKSRRKHVSCVPHTGLYAKDYVFLNFLYVSECLNETEVIPELLTKLLNFHVIVELSSWNVFSRSSKKFSTCIRDSWLFLSELILCYSICFLLFLISFYPMHTLMAPGFRSPMPLL